MPQGRAELLLGSPLGLQFLAGCLGFAFGQTSSEQLGLDPVTGKLRSQAAGRPRRQAARPHRQDVDPREVRAAVGAAVSRGEWQRLLDLDEFGLLAVLAGDHPGFGGGAGMPALIALAQEELRPVADALVSSPAARRWWDPVDRVDQRFLEWDGWPRLAGPAVERAVREAMQAARAENAQGLRRTRRHGIPVRDCWWSVPEFAVQSLTTAGFNDVSAIALARFIDAFTPLDETGATVWSMQIAPQARVAEITGPSDWQALVRSYPQDVTGTHAGEWGSDSELAGPWRLPNWEQVMDHYDGVHLTIGGYVACSGLVLTAGGGFTMLAGWIPDATVWLRDVTTGHRRLGRWRGNPQSIGSWDDLRDAWTPDDQ